MCVENACEWQEKKLFSNANSCKHTFPFTFISWFCFHIFDVVAVVVVVVLLVCMPPVCCSLLQKKRRRNDKQWIKGNGTRTRQKYWVKQMNSTISCHQTIYKFNSDACIPLFSPFYRFILLFLLFLLLLTNIYISWLYLILCYYFSSIFFFRLLFTFLAIHTFCFIHQFNILTNLYFAFIPGNRC